MEGRSVASVIARSARGTRKGGREEKGAKVQASGIDVSSTASTSQSALTMSFDIGGSIWADFGTRNAATITYHRRRRYVFRGVVWTVPNRCSFK